ALARDADLRLLDGDLDAIGHGALELALRALHRDDRVLEGDRHPRRDRDRLLSNARHGYQNSQMPSPPTPALRACRPVIIPSEVDTTAVPRPPRTFGSRSAGT